MQYLLSWKHDNICYTYSKAEPDGNVIFDGIALIVKSTDQQSYCPSNICW